jgi:hypothetical protein
VQRCSIVFQVCGKVDVPESQSLMCFLRLAENPAILMSDLSSKVKTRSVVPLKNQRILLTLVLEEIVTSISVPIGPFSI